jgi:hypothetical protein
MDVARLTIPAVEAGALRRELLGLYAMHADALHHEVLACLEAEEHGAGLRARRAEMAAVAQFLDQLGWEAGADDEPTALTGSRAVVAEALAALFAIAAEELAADPRAALAPEPELVEVSRAFWRAILALARVVDAAARRPPA